MRIGTQVRFVATHGAGLHLVWPGGAPLACGGNPNLRAETEEGDVQGEQGQGCEQPPPEGVPGDFGGFAMEGEVGLSAALAG